MSRNRMISQFLPRNTKRGLFHRYMKKYSNIAIDAAPDLINNTSLSYIEKRIDFIEKDLRERVTEMITQKIILLEKDVDAKFDVLTIKVHNLEKNVDMRFNNIDKRIDTMDGHFNKRFDAMDGHFNKRLDKIEYFLYRSFIAIFVMVSTSVLGPYLQPLIDKFATEKN